MMTQHSSPDHAILNALTRIKMPRGFQSTAADNTIECEGLTIPVYRCHTAVLGSGAAGLRAAVELKRRDIDVLIVTSGVGMGTSACSGSDKQTLHTTSTQGNGDNFKKMAQALGAGGAMDMDVAYVESVGSVQALSGLQFMGLPLPTDRYGAPLRYQTDHDEFGRATSCGPRTSRLMVKVLADETLRLGVRTLLRSYGIGIVKECVVGNERVTGLIVINNDRSYNEFGYAYIACSNLVLATGGPGELYRDSVYPLKCHGSLGLALDAGIVASNLTESQFGISSGREKFPWNLSGSYMQVMPHVYSVDSDGNKYPFLADYFPTTAAMCNSVFLKGYQWPFHADRTLNFESSLVDLAIYEQQKEGRKVYLDFLRNPQPVNANDSFSISNCSDTVISYLTNNHVNGDTPIARLTQMNPLAIELYRQNGTDLTKEPLQIGVNNQHMNGGVEVDLWGRTSLSGCYAIGEVASTHGVTRPGGAALNSGQVFALRVADYIRGTFTSSDKPEASPDTRKLSELIVQGRSAVSSSEVSSHMPLFEIKNKVQETMSNTCGFICDPNALQSAEELFSNLRQRYDNGEVTVENQDQLADYFLWHQHVHAAAAVARSMVHYVENNGGSRGARMILADDGQHVPDSANGYLTQFRFKADNFELRSVKQTITPRDGNLDCEFVATNNAPNLSSIFFEKNWMDYLTGEVYSDDRSNIP